MFGTVCAFARRLLNSRGVIHGMLKKLRVRGVAVEHHQSRAPRTARNPRARMRVKQPQPQPAELPQSAPRKPAPAPGSPAFVDTPSGTIGAGLWTFRGLSTCSPHSKQKEASGSKTAPHDEQSSVFCPRSCSLAMPAELMVAEPNSVPHSEQNF